MSTRGRAEGVVARVLEGERDGRAEREGQVRRVVVAFPCCESDVTIQYLMSNVQCSVSVCDECDLLSGISG